MNKEQAIIQLEYRKDFATPDQIEALDMAISALSADGEYIKKEDAIKAFEKSLLGNYILWDRQEVIKKDMKERMSRLPTRSFPEELSEDGTLTVHVSDGSKVNRVFVMGDNIFGGLYYPDSAEDKGEWIPITTRPMTEEEKEAYRGEYDPNDMTMYDCQMPEDGQEVLVTTRYGDVATDTFYHDDGWYFENFCDDGDVLAWQPLPEPYKKGE